MFGALIIGDEILSGKRQDKHFPKIIEILKARGLALGWSMYLPDEPAVITAVLSSTLAREDIVFCFGGIGATPDDTPQCAAKPEASNSCCTRMQAGNRGTFRRRGYPSVSRWGISGRQPHRSQPLHRVRVSVMPHHFFPGFPEMAGRCWSGARQRVLASPKQQPPVDVAMC